MTEPESLTIAPDPSAWPAPPARNCSPDAARFRKELGLPADRPIVMTGHQAGFWHAGILAKYLAADAFAAKGAALAFLFVDQDRPERIAVRYPVAEPLGNLAVRELAYTAAGREEPPTGGLLPRCVREGLGSIDAAVRAHAHEPILARRIALAARDLYAPLMSEHARRAPLLFATDLWRTDLFARAVERMQRDPEACILAYNAAVAGHPDAGIRPLTANQVQDRWEFPLWHLPINAPRRHVYAEDLPSIPREELAPKALLMTGLLRLAGCDLFIHGLGGAGADASGGYDAITEAWLSAWLGEATSLAPVTLVTATRYLPLEHAPAPSPREVEHVVWLAHHARHNPGQLGLRAVDQQRRALVGQITAAAPRVRARLFHDLHRLLDRYRESHAPALHELDLASAAARARATDDAVLHDRAWPFPLYPRESLQLLRDETRRAFGLAPGPG